MAKNHIVAFIVLLLVLDGGSGICGTRIREEVRQTYSSQIGVRELGGNNRGREIRQYLASTGLGEGHAWCAAFVKWVLTQHGIQTTGANAWSPSWFPASRVFYRNGRTSRQPMAGDVFGIHYPKLRRIGHVGFVDSYHGDYFITVEGNTNGDGSRDGDGVHRKRRLKRQVSVISDWIGI